MATTTHGEAAPDLFGQVPDRASVYEVSPRDGLQNEDTMIPLEGKRRLIEALVAAGLQRIEITTLSRPNGSRSSRTPRSSPDR